MDEFKKIIRKLIQTRNHIKLFLGKRLLIKFSKEKTLSILDYGFQAFSPSLFCSTQGVKSTIFDIDGVLNAAKERFKREELM